MLSLTITRPKMLNDETYEFIEGKTWVIQCEHSLVSLRKWEAKYHKPFLTKGEKTWGETVDYIRCMTITQHVPEEAYQWISAENISEVNSYMEDPMTATWFGKEPEGKGKINGRQVTAELIYHWMIALNIPQEYQKWHLNQLLTLIKVCNEENKPPKKRSQKELIAQYAEQNESRRRKFNSKG